MADSAATITSEEARPLLMPPGWELVDWVKSGAHVHLEATAPDGQPVKAHFEILPVLMEADPLTWLKQVIDLELLWNLEGSG
jgi:hypothetical protein